MQVLDYIIRLHAVILHFTTELLSQTTMADETLLRGTSPSRVLPFTKYTLMYEYFSNTSCEQGSRTCMLGKNTGQPFATSLLR